MVFLYSDSPLNWCHRLDLVAVDKKNETCKIIDFAVPGDSKIRKRKYLARELQIIWKAKVKV